MVYKKYCVKCKSQDNLPVKPYRKRIYSNGDVVGYFMCNPCNSERARRYTNTKAGKLAHYRANKKQYLLNSHKIKARSLLRYHIGKGHVIRPLECSKCLIKGTPDAHHPDYAKPLEVIWLCRQCHALLHRLNKSVSH